MHKHDTVALAPARPLLLGITQALLVLYREDRQALGTVQEHVQR